jgi:uncharacterized tellurite resistance protein B-like protein
MNLFSNPVDGFSPELYLATLVKVAHSDGLHPTEEVFLKERAENFGLDLNNLPPIPDDLSQLPASTRIFLYRDALMLAYADGHLSEQEENYLAQLAQKMGLSEKTTIDIKEWINNFSNLLDRMENIIKAVTD